MSRDRSMTKEAWIRARYAWRSQVLKLKERRLGIPAVGSGAFSFSELPGLLRKPDPMCFDIGACDGIQSKAILDAVPGATLHCFEPEPRNLWKLRRSLAGTDAHIHEIVLTDNDGPVLFWRSGGAPEGREDDIPEGYAGSGSLSPPRLHKDLVPWVTFDESMTVTGFTLDTWCQQNGVSEIDFIWMDVQGAEHLVFAGGERMLRSTRYIHTEYSNLPLYQGQVPLVDLLRQLGEWDVLWRTNTDALLRNRRLDEGGSS